MSPTIFILQPVNRSHIILCQRPLTIHRIPTRTPLRVLIILLHLHLGLARPSVKPPFRVLGMHGWE
jgi:hypothetical protein